MSRPSRHLRGVLPLLVCLLLAAPTPAAAQQARSLSLADAVRMSHASSEAIAIAVAAIDDAAGSRIRAAGAKRMHLGAFTSVDRALRSEYDGIDFGAPADGSSADALPFGSPTTYRLGFELSQPVFTGGRATALGRAAERGEQASRQALASTAARVTLEVAQAYYDAVLAEQMVAIVEGTLAQADSTLSLAERTLDAGRTSEFAVLRARVARDRQRPVVVRQRGERDVAMLQLRRLVDVPAGTALELTTPLEPAIDVPTIARAMWPASLDGRDADSRAPRPATATLETDRYAVVREATARLEQQRQLVTAARAERFGGISLISRWERVAYARGDIPANRDFRTNWTVGARVDLPILSGGQQPADEAQARAGMDAAAAELRQAEELSAFATRAASARLATAEAAWQASEGGVEQAARAFDIATLRHREGLAIQLELDDARLALEAARSERARAARDLRIEQLRVVLLPALPPSLALSAR